MPFNIGAPELVIILIIALIVLGPGKLPEVGQALGRTIREFRRASTEIDPSAPAPVRPAEPAVSSAEVDAEQPAAGSRTAGS